MNALPFVWPIEGHINKLKLVKQQMYGRAGIELMILAMGRRDLRGGCLNIPPHSSSSIESAGDPI